MAARVSGEILAEIVFDELAALYEYDAPGIKTWVGNGNYATVFRHVEVGEQNSYETYTAALLTRKRQGVLFTAVRVTPIGDEMSGRSTAFIARNNRVQVLSGDNASPAWARRAAGMLMAR